MANKTLLLNVAVYSLLLTTVLGQKAQAATFNLDFETTLDGRTLNARRIDGPGQFGYSTTAGNVNEIWEDAGITITTSGTSAPLGLFQSNCLPRRGVSNDGFTTRCNRSNSLGDPDLATGNGSYGDITYDTAPQGNVLIFEENPGNRTPDDIASGGTIRFDFDRRVLSSVKIDEIGLIDDVRGSIFVKYLDGTTDFRQNISVSEENALTFFSPTDGQVDYFTVSFNGSGALSGVVFSEFKQVPEPMTILGTLTAGVFGFIAKRKRASSENQ